MSKSGRKRRNPLAVEANLIPVLSCMFLLIPALLLAMEFAPFASVSVRPPMFCNGTRDEQAEDAPGVTVNVRIRSDGIETSLRRTDAPGPDVETFPVTADGQDFDALESFAAAVKRNYPQHTEVTLSAEGDVTLSTLVGAMDALRGRQCSLAQAEFSDDCLLWQVVVSS